MERKGQRGDQLKPIIGVSAVCHEKTLELKHQYLAAVMQAGGLPFVLPFVERLADIEQVCQMLDGLLLTGGADISPSYFDEEPQIGLGQVSPLRDRAEWALTRQFLQLDKPIFAICRGHQVLNVAAGGNLYQDIPMITGRLQHSQKAPREHLSHQVAVSPGSLLHQSAEKLQFRVNSFHHQAVKEVAPGWVASALSQDGVVEAIESKSHRYALGVQWHPEDATSVDDVSRRLFSAFVTACQEKSPFKNLR